MPAEWVLSVSELNEYARKLLAGDPVLRAIRVRGELSGFKRHFSGHLYFSIKDAAARVQCVMFRQYAQSLAFEPRDGMQVILSGSASIFARDGNFQIYVEQMQSEGKGDLYRRFEELKAQLLAEGLFDASLKKPIPFLPKRVGIVTSRSGAVFHDIIKVLKRRYPSMPVLLVPVAVQGDGAAQEIARAIASLNERRAVDVMLVGRGGGSIEDLWPFNEEIVARAIHASKIPVISCVGHEVDFCIADFVADVRAATPSVAAELAVPVYADVYNSLSAFKRRATLSARAKLAGDRARLLRLSDSPAIKNAGEVLIIRRREGLSAVRDRLAAALFHKLEAERHKLAILNAKLGAINPNAVLGRGYAYLTREEHLLDDANNVSPGDKIQAVIKNGIICAAVESVCGRE